MARIADGDRDAFGALYRRRRMDVYRFALHMTASTATRSRLHRGRAMHAARLRIGDPQPEFDVRNSLRRER